MKAKVLTYIMAAGLTLFGTAALMAQTPDTTAAATEQLSAPVEEAAAAVAATIDAAPVLDKGDTAWIIVATILVMLMTVPGLAFFYGGLVRRKNVLSIMMQCMVITAVVSIEWIVVGYSMVFGSEFMPGEDGSGGSFWGAVIGGFDKAFLHGIRLDTLFGSIPELVFVLFQCMFAVITPALIIGAFAERIKFSGFLLFTILWSLIVYNPMAHWVWGGGWMGAMGALDFAGGTVVHINAGVSALVMALMLGRRKAYRPGGQPITPHNVPFVVIGAALLWLGWFGFNAGSGLAADGLAGNAFLVTHLATAVAAVTWMTLEWVFNSKPSVVGICTGVVAGLVAITPAAGTVDAMGAVVIGLASAIICYVFVAIIKPKAGYDDSLDAFGVHGVGGFVGAILTGVFATQFVTGDGGAQGALYGDWRQLGVQTVVNLTAAVFSGVMTWLLFVIVDRVAGLRVDRESEAIGLDISQHGEFAYSDNE